MKLPNKLDLNSKILRDRLTANLGVAWSHMAFLGEYENAVNIIMDHLVKSGSRVDTVAHPLLYLMRHSLELGYKANLEYFTKYSGKAIEDKILKSHNLSVLHHEFKKHIDLVKRQHQVDRDSIKEFNTYFNLATQLICQLGAEEASTFRYVKDLKGNQIFDWNDTRDVSTIKEQYDKAITMLVHTSDIFAPYTDYADLLEKVPDFEYGTGRVLFTFPSWQLNDVARKLSEQYEELDQLLWRDKNGTKHTILTVGSLCYFLPIRPNIKAKLKEFIPSLFQVLNDDQISWTTIDKKFEEIVKEREVQMQKSKKPLSIEASFFDIIVAQLDGDPSAKRLFLFFDNLLQELAGNVSAALKGQLKTTIFNLLTNLDKCYLNFIGELAVLNQLLKSRNFDLIKTAYPLPNGKDIDLQMFDKKNAATILIEVVNIHIDRQFHTSEEIERFLNQKMHQKIIDKNKNLPTPIPFLLATVIWGSAEELQQIAQVLRSGFKPMVENVIEPLAYASFYNEVVSIPKFGTLTTLFS